MTRHVTWAAAAVLAGALTLAGCGTAVEPASSTKTTHKRSTGQDCAAADVYCPGESLPGSQPAADKPDTSPDVFKIGEPGMVSQGGSDVGTLAVSAVDVYESPRQEFSEAPANGHYVKVTLKAKATKGRAFTVSPYDFVAIGPAGHRYDAGNGNAIEEIGSGRMFQDTTLNPGETFTATMYFDVPKPHGKIAYIDEMSGRVLGAWRF